MKVRLNDFCLEDGEQLRASELLPDVFGQWLEDRQMSLDHVCCFKFSPYSLHLKRELTLLRVFEFFHDLLHAESTCRKSLEKKENDISVIDYIDGDCELDSLRIRIVQNFCTNLLKLTQSFHWCTRFSSSGKAKKVVICSMKNLKKAKVSTQVTGDSDNCTQLNIISFTTSSKSWSSGLESLFQNIENDIRDCYLIKSQSVNHIDIENLARSILKLELVRTSLSKSLNLNWVAACSKSEACFIMYNASRMKNILVEFTRRAETGYYGEMALAHTLTFEGISLEPEWNLVKILIEFSPLLKQIFQYLTSNDNTNHSVFPIHTLYIYLSSLARSFSSYYNKNKILMEPKNQKVINLINMRFYVVQCVYKVFIVCLRLLDCEPLDRM